MSNEMINKAIIEITIELDHMEAVSVTDRDVPIEHGGKRP